MKFKTVILITLLLAIFTIGAVSATDDNTTDELQISNIDSEMKSIESNSNELQISNIDSEVKSIESNSDNLSQSNKNIDDNLNQNSVNEILHTDPSKKLKFEVIGTNTFEKSINGGFGINATNMDELDEERVDIRIDVGNRPMYLSVTKSNPCIYLGDILKDFNIGEYPVYIDVHKYNQREFITTFKIIEPKTHENNTSTDQKDSTTKITTKSPKITVKAPTITAYYKANKYFKVSVKKGGKAIKNLKLNVKVYTGSKYKNYVIKTNKNGVAILSTKKFKIGSHKVKITSKNSKYEVSKTSKIVIKKKSNIMTVTIKIPEPNPYPNKKKLKTGDTLYTINSLGPQYGKGVYAQVINMGQRIHTKILKVKFYFENEYTGKIKTKIVTKIRNYNRYDGGESTAYTNFIPDYIPYKATVWYKKI